MPGQMFMPFKAAFAILTNRPLPDHRAMLLSHMPPEARLPANVPPTMIAPVCAKKFIISPLCGESIFVALNEFLSIPKLCL